MDTKGYTERIYYLTAVDLPYYLQPHFIINKELLLDLTIDTLHLFKQAAQSLICIIGCTSIMGGLASA